MTHIYLKLVGSALLWGATWVAGRILGRSMGPFSSAFLRFLLASLFLVFLTRRLESSLPPLTRRTLPWLLLLAASGIFAYNALFFAGLRTVPAGRAALILASAPSVMALCARVLFKERLSRTAALGIAISLGGVALIVAGSETGLGLANGLTAGDMCIFGCVATWTVYTLAGKKAMEHVAPYGAVTWSCILGALMLLPAALAFGLIQDIRHADPTVWGCLVFFGVLATGFGFSWYYEGVRALGPTKAGVFINLVPVVAVFLGWIVLDEQPAVTLAVGGTLVLCGVWLTNKRSGNGSRAKNLALPPTRG